MLRRVWRKGKPPMLLERMQIVVVTMENSIVSLKIKKYTYAMIQ